MIKHHGLAEEVTDIEEINRFDSQTEKSSKCIPLHIPQQYSEATSQTNITIMPQPLDEVVNSSIVKIISRQVATNTIMVGEEKEEAVKTKKTSMVEANISFDSQEPYVTDQPETKETIDELKLGIKPETQEAAPNLVQSQTYITGETQILQNVMSIQDDSFSVNMATPSMNPLEALSTTEVETIIKEGKVTAKIAPESRKATSDFVLKESITVTQVTEGATEDTLGEKPKPGLTHVDVDISAVESCEITEVYSEVKPEKYYPELIVPTETARKSVIPKGKAATSNITQPEELEQPLSLEKHPQGTTGQLSVITGDYILVTEARVNEKESYLVSEKIPDLSNVTESYTTKMSVEVETTSSEEAEIAFKSSPMESVSADIDITLQESVLTSVVNPSEAEESTDFTEQPTEKYTTSSLTCLETSTTSETVVNETEVILKEKEKPTEVIPLGSIAPSEHVVVEEINLGELPSDFTDKLKYPLADVSTTYGILEATQISDTVIQESESPITVEQVTPISAIDSSIPQQEITITQTTVAEKEDILHVPDLPESHKGKPSVKTPVHSIIVEEVAPEIIAKNLEKPEMPDIRAKLDQEALNETVIEETIPSDGTIDYESSVLEEKTADFSILPKEGIDVTETVISDREKEYTKVDKTKVYHAETTVTTNQEIIEMEVKTEDDISPFINESIDSKITIPYQDTQQSIEIIDMLPSEKESELPAFLKPDEKTAYVDLANENTSISILEVTSTDKESDIIKQPIQEEKVVCSFSGKTIPIKSEIISSENVSQLYDDKPKTGKAIPGSNTLEEILVTETNAVETEKLLPENKKPLTEKANIHVKEQKEISITETITHDMEEILISPVILSDKSANVCITGQDVAEKEEIILADELDNFKPVSLNEIHAHVSHDLNSSLIGTESFVSESEENFSDFHKPEQQKAVIDLKRESNTLSVLQVDSLEQEITSTTNFAPNLQSADMDMLLNTPAITSEVISNMDTENLEVSAPSIAKGEVDNITFESVISCQVTTGEKESVFIKEALPELKNAETDIIKGEGITVSINIPQDKEAELPSPEIISEKTAQFDISGQFVAESSIIIPDVNINELKIPSVEEDKVNISHLPIQISVYLETTPCEIENKLEENIKPNIKQANLGITEETSVTVTETYSNDRESSLKLDEKPETKQAGMDISPSLLALAEEIIPQNTTGDLFPVENVRGIAQIKPLPFEAVISSTDTTIEKEGFYQEKIKKPLEKPETVFEEEQSLTIFDTQVQETETDFDIEKVKTKTATLDISTHGVVQTSEVIVDTSTDKLPKFDKLYGSAQPDLIPLESGVIQTEITVQDSEKSFKSDDTNSVSVETSFSPEESIQIIQVTVADKETDFVIDDKPESKIIKSKLTPSLDVPQAQEIISQESIANLPKDDADIALAETTAVPLNTFSSKETFIGEKESDLPLFARPENKTADVEYEEASRSLILTEVVTSETEKQDIAKFQPKDTQAETEIILTEATGITEIISLNNVSTFIEDITPLSQAVSDRIPLTSLNLEETLTAEKEGILKPLVKPRTEDIDVVFEAEKSISVSETIAEELELDLKMADTPKKKATTGDMVGFIVPQKEEVFPEQSTSDVPQNDYTTTTALMKPIPQEALQTSEVTASERESTEMNILPQVKNTAQSTFVEEHSIDITEVSLTEKENDFSVPTLPDKKTAFPNIEEISKEVAKQNQIQSITETGPIDEFIMPQTNIQSTHIPLESVSESITTVHESEQPFEKRSTSSTTAHVICTEMQSVNITETLSEDKEDDLSISKLSVEKTASINLSPSHDVSISSEVLVTDSISQITENIPSTVSAIPSNEYFSSLTVTEIKLAENEDEFDVYKAPDNKNASIDFEQNSTLNVTEIICQDKESEIPEKVQPSEVCADIDIIPKQTLEVTETVSHSETQEICLKIPSPAQATADNILYQSLQSTHTTAGETESILHPEVMAPKSTADITLEEDQSITVLETVTSDKENLLTPDNIPEMKQASPHLSGHHIVSQKEVLPEESTGDFDLPVISEHTVTSQHIAHDSLITSETIITEKESSLHEVKPIKNTATSTFTDEQKSINIFTLPTLENEDKLDISKATSKFASPAFTTQQVPQTEEILTNVSTDELSKFDIITTQAQEIPQLLESIIQTETRVQEAEINVTIEPKPSSLAQVDFVQQSGICVSETETLDQENEFISKPKVDSKTATTEFTVTQLPSKTEIVADDTFNPFKELAPNATSAETVAITLKSLITSINDIVENEDSVPKFTIPEEKTAFMTMDQTNTEIQIEEIITQDKEGELTNDSLPTVKKPNIDIVSQETVTISETTISDNVIHLDEKETDKKIATPVPIESITSTLSENLVLEQEESFSSTAVDGKTADISIYPDESINVDQVLPNESCDNLIIDSQTSSKIASLDITPHDTVSSEQITVLNETGDLPEITPKSALATSKYDLLQEFVTTETLPADKESSFEKHPTLEKKKVEVLIDSQQGLNVIEIMTTEMESIMKEKLNVPECVADKTVTDSQAIEITEVTSDVGTGEIPDFTLIDSVATLNQIPYKPISITEVSSQELESNLIPEEVIAQHAASNIPEQQVLFITSVFSGEKEMALVENEKPKEQKGSPQISGLEIAESEEVISHTIPKEFQKQPEKLQKASVDQSLLESLIKDITIIHDKESNFKGEDKVKPINAGIEMVTDDSLNITQTELAEKEGIYTSAQSVTTRKASTVIDNNNEAILLTEIIVQSSTCQVDTDSPCSSVATQSNEIIYEVQVTDNQAHEKEDDFVGAFKPKSTTAALDIATDECSKIVQEVIPEEKENKFEDGLIPDTKVAQPTITSTHEIAQTTLLVTSSHTSDLSKLEPNTFTANISQDVQEGLKSTEIIIHDKEKILHPDQVKFESAKFDIDNVTGINITEVTLADVEGVYNTEEKPKMQTAKPDISTKDVAEISEVTAESTLSELITLKVTDKQANVETIPLVSVQQSIPIIHENEKTFLNKHEPDKILANVTFREDKSINISEVLVDDKEGILPEFRASDIQLTPQDDILIRQGITIVETITDSSVTDFGKETDQTNQAEIKQDTLMSIISSETQVQDTEVELKPSTIHKSEADVLIDGKHSLIITEVASGDKEKECTSTPDVRKGIAKPDIITQESVEILDISPSVDLTAFSSTKLDLVQASSSIKPVESVIVSQDIIQEQSTSINKVYKPTESQSTIIMEENKSFDTLHVIIGDKEDILSPRQPIVDGTAMVKIDGRDIAETTEVIPTDEFTLVKPEARITGKAFPTHIPHENILNTFVTVEEKENEFISPNKKLFEANIQHDSFTAIVCTELEVQETENSFSDTPRQMRAEANFDVEVQQPVEITELTVTENEEPLAIECERRLDNAQSDITEQNSTIVFDVETQLNTVPMNDSDFPLSSASKIKDECISLIQTELLIQESENILEEKPSKPKISAHINVEEIQSTLVTEVQMGDSEKGLKINEKYSLKKAQPNVFTQASIEITDVDSHMNVVEIDTTLPECSTVNISQDSLFGIIQTDVKPQDRETQLDKMTVPEIASLNIDQQQPLIIKEVILDEREKKFENLPTPEKKTAKPAVISQDSVEILDINLQSHTTDLESESPTQVSASLTHGTSICLEQLQPCIHESETILKEDFINKASANIDVEEINSLVVTHQPFGERENILDIVDNAQPKQARSDILLQESIQITDITSHDDTTSFDDIIPTGRLADLNIDETSPVVVTETVPGEQETKINVISEIKQRRAVKGIVSQESIQVLNLESNMDAVPLENITPNTTSANIDVTESQSITVTETKPEEKVQNIGDREDIKQRKAKTTLMNQQSLEITDNRSHINPQPLKDTLPNVLSASLKLEESRPIIVTGVTPEEKEKALKKPRTLDKGKAETKIISQQSVEVLDITTNMNSVPFETDTSSPLSVEVRIDKNEPLIIQEVQPQETEKLKQPDKCEKDQAVVKVSYRDSLQVTDTKSEDNIVQMSEIYPTEVSANVNTSQTNTVLVTEIVPQDSETILSQASEVVKKKAKPETVNLDAIQVSDTMTRMDTVPFEREAHTKSTAKREFDHQESLIITEAVPEEKERKLKKEECVKEQKLEPKIIQKNSVEVLDTNTNMDFVPFKTVPVDKSSANINIEESYPVSITETVSVDKESTFIQPKLRRKENAKPEVSYFEPLQIMQTDFNISSDELKLSTIDNSIATVDMAEVHSISISETVTEEKECSKELVTVDKKQAQPKITSQNSLEILDMKPQEDAIPINKEIPNQSSAVIKLQEAQPLTVIETIPQEVEKEEKVLKVKREKAIHKVIKKKSFEVLDTEPHMDTVPIDDVKPTTESVKISVKDVCSLEVVETIPGEKEIKLQEQKQRTREKATTKFISQKSLEILDIESNTNTEPLDNKDIDTESASVVQDMLSGIIQSELMTHETIDQLQEQRTPNTATVDVGIIKKHPFSTTETLTEESLKKFVTSEPNKKRTKSSFIPQTAVNVSNVKSEEQIIPIISESPDQPLPEVRQEPLTGLMQTEIHLQDIIKDLDNVKETSSSLANVNVQENQSLMVTETVIQDVEQNIQVKSKQKKKASPSMSSQQSIEISETDVQEQADEIPDYQPSSTIAIPSVQTMKSLIISEEVPQQSETISEQFEKPSELKPDVNYVANDNIMITEVVPEQKVNPLSTSLPRINTLQTKLVDSFEIAEQEEIIATDFVTQSEPKKVENDSAKVKLIPFHAPVQTDVVTEDKEDTYKIEKIRISKKADTNIECLKKGAEITQVLLQDKERSFDIKPKLFAASASISFDGIDSTIVTEIIPGSATTDHTETIDLKEAENAQEIAPEHLKTVSVETIPYEQESFVAPTNKDKLKKKKTVQASEIIQQGEEVPSKSDFMTDNTININLRRGKAPSASEGLPDSQIDKFDIKLQSSRQVTESSNEQCESVTVHIKKSQVHINRVDVGPFRGKYFVLFVH